MYYRVICVFVCLLFTKLSFGQVDSLAAGAMDEAAVQAQMARRDSMRYALRMEVYRDSVRRVRDSIRSVGNSVLLGAVKYPDRNSPNRFRDSIIQYYMLKNFDLNAWKSRFNRVSEYGSGIARPRGELWSVIVVFSLLLLFALLRNSFHRQMGTLLQAFYSNRILGFINKEDGFFSTWPFVFLYLLFGFTLGMLLFEFTQYYQLSYGYSGLNWYLRLSFLIIVVYTVKVFIVRILGFLFEVDRIAREYVSVLFMTYFCAAILLLPVVIAFSLTPARYAPYYIALSGFLLIGIYGIQFVRAMGNILSGYRFSKVYLIVYLCALEISPLLILIKALRF